MITLGEALRIARNDPPTVRVAAARVGSASAQADAARAAYYPSLSVSTSPSLGFSDRPFQINPVTGQVLRLQNSSFSVDGSATGRVTLWDFGRTANAVTAAERGTAAARADERISALQSMTSAAQAYLTVLNDRESVSAARSIVAQREAHLRIAQGMVDAGARPPIEVTRARVNLESARLDLTLTEARERNDRAVLAASLGIDPLVEIDPAPVDDGAIEVSDDPAWASRSAVEGRPEFAAQRARVAQAEAQMAQTRAGRNPVLSATAQGSVNYQQVLTGTNFGGVSESVSAGVSLTWPLFDPVNRANLAVAEANLRTARESLEAQSLQVRTTAVQAAMGLRSARLTLEQSERLAAGATANLEQAEGRYRGGAAPLLELVDAQAADAGAGVAVLRARLMLQMARVQVLSATGGIERLAR